MATKKSKKKSAVKIDPNAEEKVYLMNIINKLDQCAKENETNSLGSYFKSKADLNRERLKTLK